MGARSVVGAEFHGVLPGGVLGAGDLFLAQLQGLGVTVCNKVQGVQITDVEVDNDAEVREDAEVPAKSKIVTIIIKLAKSVPS